MRSPRMIFLFVLVIAVIVIFSFRKQSGTDKDISRKNDRKSLSSEMRSDQNSRESEIKSQSFGAVEIVVEPKVLIPGESMVFSVSLNTHSVDLSYELEKIAEITDDQGKIYQATEWTGGTGGHHLEGELVFQPLDQTAKNITLTLDRIDNQRAEFNWKL